MRITELIFFLFIFTTGCTEKSQQPKAKTNVGNNITSNKSEQDTLNRKIYTIDSSDQYGGIIPSIYDPCADSIGKLITSSNFLLASPLDLKKDIKYWKKKWNKNGYFMTELDNEDNFRIRAYIKTGEPETGPFTLAWLQVDPINNQLTIDDLNDEKSTPIKCDTVLLKYIIDHCIDWNKK